METCECLSLTHLQLGPQIFSSPLQVFYKTRIFPNRSIKAKPQCLKTVLIFWPVTELCLGIFTILLLQYFQFFLLSLTSFNSHLMIMLSLRGKKYENGNIESLSLSYQEIYPGLTQKRKASLRLQANLLYSGDPHFQAEPKPN